MRLIDAEHLKWNVGGIKCGTLTVAYLNWILEHEEPTVDAVPVIRCKDCKYLRLTGTVWKCQNRLVMMLCEPNDYCSRAERKDNG